MLIDTETGQVTVERYIACHDVGRAINPALVEGQIQGGVAQGIGMALMDYLACRFRLSAGNGVGNSASNRMRPGDCAQSRRASQ